MLKLFLTLLTSLTFAQSPFWRMEVLFGGDTQPPSVATSPSAVGDINKVTLTWTDPTESDFDSVRIYAGTTANPTTWIASVAKGVQSYKDSNYSYNTIRHYRIKSKDQSGNLSAYTSSVNDTVMIWLGSELLSNTNFASNTTGWAESNGTIKWYNTDWNAVSRTNALLDSATSTSNVSVRQNYAFTSGYKYRLNYTYHIPSANATAKKILWGFIGGTSDLYGAAQSASDSWTTNTEYLTATASHTTLRVYQANSAGGTNSITSGDKIYIDDVSLKRILNP